MSRKGMQWKPETKAEDNMVRVWKLRGDNYKVVYNISVKLI